MMAKKILSLFAVLLLHWSVQAQADSCTLRISLLTCSPGEELYAAWGHTAIRVTDRSSGIDRVYNYGTFDDSDPLFLANFTKGLMWYSLSAYPFSEFVREYQYYGRGVIEQALSLSCTDKEKIYAALQENSRDENRFYQYYFHTDNCTTRARDIILKNSSPVQTKNIIGSPAPTYRNLIHVYLNKSQPWNKLGIDILLGANLDKTVDNVQAQFLPDNLMTAFDSSYISNTPLVGTTQVILPAPAPAGKTSFTPLLLFSILAIAIVLLSFSKSAPVERWLMVFDSVFFLLLGLLGILLVVLWIIRVDDVCRNNFNLLWALPTYTFFAFFLTKKKTWVRSYFKIVSVLSILLAASWFFLPQQLNLAILPLLLIIIVRSWRISR